MSEPNDCVACWVYPRTTGDETMPFHGHKRWSECSDAEKEIADRVGYPEEYRDAS